MQIRKILVKMGVFLLKFYRELHEDEGSITYMK